MKVRPYFLIVVALAALGLLLAPQLIVVAPREATTCLCLTLLELRVGLERARARIDELHLEAEDASCE
ncbi:MAG TPA: hypothetical protein VHC69_27925 [Polyangiaceae bacterium]|nr:hypothetical protein [Polyangiaceae bacterium]